MREIPGSRGRARFESRWASAASPSGRTPTTVHVLAIPHTAYIECIGGALTMAGLGMRFVSIPMIINMAVAVISVKLKEVSSVADFGNLDEPLYALTYVGLLFSDAGIISIDAALDWLISRLAPERVATRETTRARSRNSATVGTVPA